MKLFLLLLMFTFSLISSQDAIGTSCDVEGSGELDDSTEQNFKNGNSADCEKNRRLIAESDFAVQMLQLLPNNKSSVFSPLSISFALAILHSGAKGNTKHQIEDAILKGDTTLSGHHSSLLKAITNPGEGVEFNVANRFYLRNCYPILPEYLAAIDTLYAAKAVPLDFNKREACAKEVNEFIFEATKGKIGQMVTPDSFREEAVAIIVNALYMKAVWADKFNAINTHEENFTGHNGEERKVEMMSKLAHHDYYSDESVQAVSLAYKDKSYKFTWILPVERNGLDKVRSELTGDKLQQILTGMKNTNLNIKVPKMKIETDLELKDMLESLGVTAVFSNKTADLSGISEKPIYVSNAAHKALVEVDENATVAVAVTRMTGGYGYYFVPWIDFTADHPFLFVITYQKHPVGEGGTVAAAVTVMIMLPGSMGYFSHPIDFIADYPILFVITYQNHPVFIGQFV